MFRIHNGYRKRIGVAKSTLELCEDNHRDVIGRAGSGDDIWIYLYNSKSKEKSKHLKDRLTSKQSTEKVMVKTFWDSQVSVINNNRLQT